MGVFSARAKIAASHKKGERRLTGRTNVFIDCYDLIKLNCALEYANGAEEDANHRHFTTRIIFGILKSNANVMFEFT